MFQLSKLHYLEKRHRQPVLFRESLQTFYQILLKRKTSSPVKSQGKWLAEDLFSNKQVNWENTYQLPFLCATETKLRVFQFKFLRRRVATNDFLLKTGKKETDSCSFSILGNKMYFFAKKEVTVPKNSNFPA